MTKRFVPFDKFERECMPEGKTLHETMQENCNSRLAPTPEPCPNPCVPYWQPTGNRRCLDIGVVEIEEADGCGHLRFTRITDPVVWEFNDQQRCDEPRNRIERQQVNQCGGTRWVTTAELCCTPNWVGTGDIDCTQSMERRHEEDGCGNTRLRSTGFPVNWVGTGEARCEPGDIYQVEQTNQCGDTRWLTIPGACPCIPNWQPSGPERCTGQFVERQEVDGCGHTRWQPTAVAVVWSNTGETRCNGGFIQNQQISQCGTTRWSTTETPCTNSPPANQLATVWSNENIIGSNGVGAFTSATVTLDASNGMISWSHRNQATQSEAWVTGAFDRNDYEARIIIDQGAGNTVVVTGSTSGVWYDLGSTTIVNGTIRINGPGDGIRNGILFRIDIRKKNEGISGGKTFGYFTIGID